MMLYESRAHYAEFDRSIEQKWVQNTLGKGEKKKKRYWNFQNLLTGIRAVFPRQIFVWGKQLLNTFDEDFE